MSSFIEEIDPISLELFKGDDKQYQCTAVDDTGAVVNITGKTITMQVKEEIGEDVVFTLTTAQSTEIEITDGPNGKFVVKIIGSTHTATMDAHETFYYNIVIDMAGTIGPKTVAHGVFKVLDK